MKGKLLKTLAILGCFALSINIVACGDGGGKDTGSMSSQLSETSSSYEESPEEESSVEMSSEEESSQESSEEESSVEMSSEEESSETEISSSEESSEEIVDEEILVGTEGLVYTLNEAGDGYIVTGYTGEDVEIIIPSVYEGLPVKRIGDEVFLEDPLEYKIRITRVVIGGGVESIGKNAFMLCRDLEEITIPNSVISIEGRAFYGCLKLSKVHIPAGVTNIGENALGARLSEITISKKNTCYKVENGALYTMDGKTLVQYAVARENTAFIIPDGVEKIEVEAFSGARNLTSIVIPSSVKTIAAYAFLGCEGVTEFILPSELTTIGQHAFSSCYGLTEIVIPDSVINMGWSLFGPVKLTIYCEAESKPDGWHENWNDKNCPVEWGYKDN